MKKILLTFILSIFILNCSDTNHKDQELELKRKELELKEKELEIKMKETKSIEIVSKTKIDNNIELSNNENLIGKWFVPHAAFIKIEFKRNGTFIFNDFNSNLNSEEILKGNFELNNGDLFLLYDNKPKQKFNFYKGENGDLNYYIKKGSDYYFVKSEF